MGSVDHLEMAVILKPVAFAKWAQKMGADLQAVAVESVVAEKFI